MHDYREDYMKIGLNESPLDSVEDINKLIFENEKQILRNNINLFKEIVNHIKDVKDCFGIIIR